MREPLTEADVRRLLRPDELIPAIESAFRDRFPAVQISERPLTHLADGVFFSMSCFDAASRALGIKLVVVRDRAHAGPEGGVHCTYLLLDPQSTQPQLVISANYLTDLRTAATSAVATKHLARPDTVTLGIFGTGRLARAHLQTLPLVRPFQRALICGSSPQRSREFVQKISDALPGLTIEPADPRTCAAESDVISSCTSASTPLFDGRDLRPGTHLNLLGSFRPHVREVDSITIGRSRVVVDTYRSLPEMGDLLMAQEDGAISADHVVADLHELVSEKKTGRRSQIEITVFKSVGCALEDLVAAELLLQAATKGT